MSDIIVAVKPHQVTEAIVGAERGADSRSSLDLPGRRRVPGGFGPGTDNTQPLIRAMPNTPCLIGQGAVVLSPNGHVSQGQLDTAVEIFEETGKVWVLPEAQMDAVTGLSGSGPAYAYLFLEALIDGGVASGLSHEDARGLAIQTVLGAVKMAAETGQHPRC